MSTKQRENTPTIDETAISMYSKPVMAETLLREGQSPFRLGYSAVPLNLTPQDLEKKEANPAYIDYMRESTGVIETKLADAMQWAELSGWVKSSEIRTHLEEMLGILLLDSHTLRLARNRQKQLGELVRPDDDRPEKALQGCATPLETLSLLEDYPHLETLAVAELTHPLDAHAPDEMNAAVLDAIEKINGSTVSGEPYYKPKGYASILPAATVLRKQVIGDYAIKNGRIQVVKRETFLVRADNEVLDIDPELQMLVENDACFGELAQKIEGYYPHLKDLPDLGWLKPLVTSLYAKLVTEAEAAPESAR